MAEPTTDVPTPATEEQAEKPDLNVQIQDIGPARKRLTIEVPEEHIQAKIGESYEQLGDEAVIPGFRRGRAPRRLIERRFGSAVRDDVKAQIINEAYTQAIEDHDLDVIGQPEIDDIENLELPESGPLTLNVEVEVTPDVQLPDFEQLEVTKSLDEVTDEDVDKAIEQWRERAGQLEPVADAKAGPGDFIRSDIRILAGENADEEDQDAELIREDPTAYLYVPSEDREDRRGHVAGIIVENLEKHVGGKGVGDEFVISMTGPPGHEDEKIRDQPITIRGRISEIQRLELASTEQLLERMGIETEDDLRGRVREMLDQQRQREQQQDMYNQVREQLLEKVELELPEDMTTRQIERALRRQRVELMYQGLDEQQIEQRLAEMRSESEQEARRQLKLYFILERAAQQLDVEPSPNEINNQIVMMAMQQGRRPEKLRQEMQQRGDLEQLYLQLREQRALDAILEKAQVTEASGAAGDEGEQTTEPASESDS